MALPFLTLYLTRELGFSAGRAGALLALYGLVALASGPLAGRLCDAWGTRRLMLVSLTLSGMAMLVFPLVRTWTAATLMIAAWAAATESFRPAGMTAVSESAPAGLRKQAYALHRLAVNVGMSLGPAVGGFLAASSFRAIWLVDGATALASACMLLAWLDDAPPAEAEPGESLPTGRALGDPRLLYCLLASLPVSMVFFQHESALPLFLVRDLGLSEAFYGLLFTLNTLMIAALEVPLNHATAAWPHRRALALGSALFAVGFGAHAAASRGWHVVAATVVWTFGEMTLLPSLTAYIADISPARRRGEYMGLYTMAFSLAFAIGPWAGIVALDRWGPAALWSSVFAAGMLSAALFSRIR